MDSGARTVHVAGPQQAFSVASGATQASGIALRKDEYGWRDGWRTPPERCIGRPSPLGGTAVAKQGQHNNDAHGYDKSKGPNNPSKSVTITSGTY